MMTEACFSFYGINLFFCELYLFHVGQKGLPVEIPFLTQLRSIRVFAAAQLHGDFQAVSIQVVVVLHSS